MLAAMLASLCSSIIIPQVNKSAATYDMFNYKIVITVDLEKMMSHAICIFENIHLKKKKPYFEISISIATCHWS